MKHAREKQNDSFSQPLGEPQTANGSRFAFIVDITLRVMDAKAAFCGLRHSENNVYFVKLRGSAQTAAAKNLKDLAHRFSLSPLACRSRFSLARKGFLGLWEWR